MLIQAGTVALDTKLLHHTDRLSYNVSTIIGIAIATIFRLYLLPQVVFREQRTDESGTAERLTSTSSAR